MGQSAIPGWARRRRREAGLAPEAGRLWGSPRLLVQCRPSSSYAVDGSANLEDGVGGIEVLPASVELRRECDRVLRESHFVCESAEYDLLDSLTASRRYELGMIEVDVNRAHFARVLGSMRIRAHVLELNSESAPGPFLIGALSWVPQLVTSSSPRSPCSTGTNAGSGADRACIYAGRVPSGLRRLRAPGSAAGCGAARRARACRGWPAEKL